MPNRRDDVTVRCAQDNCPKRHEGKDALRQPSERYMQRAWEWLWGLSGWRLALALLLGGLLSFLITSTVLLWWPVVAQEGDTSQSTPAQQRTEHTYITKRPPKNMDLEITSAQWEGEKVVVEGKWAADVSSVHCDLFEGDKTDARLTDWWDRGVPAKMDWSHKTFTQVFVRAKGRKIENPPDPNEHYWVLCAGNFSGAWEMEPSAPIRGAPSG